MKKKLDIKIGSLEEAATGFIETWEKAESGEAIDPQDILMFDSIETLLKVLTPDRFNLLKYIRHHGHVTIRHMAKKLNREYQQVFGDIHMLHEAGLLVEGSDKKFYAPWKILHAELRI